MSANDTSTIAEKILELHSVRQLMDRFKAAKKLSEDALGGERQMDEREIGIILGRIQAYHEVIFEMASNISEVEPRSDTEHFDGGRLG